MFNSGGLCLISITMFLFEGLFVWQSNFNLNLDVVLWPLPVQSEAQSIELAAPVQIRYQEVHGQAYAYSSLSFYDGFTILNRNCFVSEKNFRSQSVSLLILTILILLSTAACAIHWTTSEQILKSEDNCRTYLYRCRAWSCLIKMKVAVCVDLKRLSLHPTGEELLWFPRN